MTVMHQCRFIHCNKWTTLVGDVDKLMGEAIHVGGAVLGCVWEISVPSLLKKKKKIVNNKSKKMEKYREESKYLYLLSII